MFTPTKAQLQTIRTTLRDIAEGGEEALSKAWLVWAELQLVAIGYADKTILITRMMPLVMACIADSDKTPEQVQKILHTSVVKRRCFFRPSLTVEIP
ncbi:MAG: hypothetical protein GTN64_08225 [Candidatus Latescibacteria bacterium]|nr:hypothetical protein [Candidatus Latescibacterota bacterium]NIO78587.1 hypothetical protein [Candidatus Latescibacterota bacterium]